jgi:hypothetical protein
VIALVAALDVGRQAFTRDKALGNTHRSLGNVKEAVRYSPQRFRRDNIEKRARIREETEPGVHLDISPPDPLILSGLPRRQDTIVIVDQLADARGDLDAHVRRGVVGQ